VVRTAVCVKQVPARSVGMMDPATGTIRREGLATVINFCDLPAIETALHVKQAVTAEVDVFTMGPMKATAAVREALSMGADRGYLLSDARFSGADVYATAYTLVQGMRMIGAYDLLVCGKQTTDGGTSQVGGTIAQMLGVPHIGRVTKLVEANGQGVTIVQELERELLTLHVSFPCVVSVEPGIFTPRLPSLKSKLAAGRQQVAVLSLEDLSDTDPTHYGVKGSPTKVEKVYPAELTPRRDLSAVDAEAAADLILSQVRRLTQPRGTR
jgi:electron transfer flavoprotein beta subunit